MHARLGLVALCLILVLAACSSPRPAPPVAAAPARPPAAPQATSPLESPTTFQAFVRDFQPIALAAGIRADTYARAMTGLEPLPGFGEILANQPEFVRPIWDYLDSAVSPSRVRDGQAMLATYGDVLNRIEAQSGVAPAILVAIWGMETDYGRNMGSDNIFAALATAAASGPRQTSARSELIAALRLLQDQDYPVSEMVSSWAGAFGQTQFMPTSFFKYARDGDGDGHIDLWRSPADALASAAVLLARQGWRAGQPWGYEVKLPAGFDLAETGLETTRPLSAWVTMGVESAEGAMLPAGEDAAALYLPAGARGPAFLLFDNFRVLMAYNNAASYALAVGLLAARIEGAGTLVTNWPRDERPLSRDERNRFQSDLAALGFDPGAVDGILGRRTRAALRRYQQQKGLAADGYPTADLLAMLDADVAARP